MKITGTIVNYYFHCKRQCWLHANRINLEDNSEDVHIGKVLHEIKNQGKKNTEISIDNIKIDKITDEYLVEVKKSDADTEATKWQLLFYLYKLREKGIHRKGKIEFIEKNKQDKKKVYFDLTSETIEELKTVLDKLEIFINNDKPPRAILEKKCKKCAYYTYCFV